MSYENLGNCAECPRATRLQRRVCEFENLGDFAINKAGEAMQIRDEHEAAPAAQGEQPETDVAYQLRKAGQEIATEKIFAALDRVRQHHRQVLNGVTDGCPGPEKVRLYRWRRKQYVCHNEAAAKAAFATPMFGLLEALRQDD